MRALRASIALVLVVAACGNRADPSAPATSPSSTAATSEPSASSTPSAATADEPARKKRPLEIKNACGEIVTVAFGEDPKAAESGRRQIAGDSSVMDGPRDAQGNMTIWLLDNKLEPIVKVHVTRGMKRVEIGRSCRTLDAR